MMIASGPVVFINDSNDSNNSNPNDSDDDDYPDGRCGSDASPKKRWIWAIIGIIALFLSITFGSITWLCVKNSTNTLSIIFILLASFNFIVCIFTIKEGAWSVLCPDSDTESDNSHITTTITPNTSSSSLCSSADCYHHPISALSTCPQCETHRPIGTYYTQIMD